MRGIYSPLLPQRSNLLADRDQRLGIHCSANLRRELVQHHLLPLPVVFSRNLVDRDLTAPTLQRVVHVRAQHVVVFRGRGLPLRKLIPAVSEGWGPPPHDVQRRPVLVQVEAGALVVVQHVVVARLPPRNSVHPSKPVVHRYQHPAPNKEHPAVLSEEESTLCPHPGSVRANGVAPTVPRAVPTVVVAGGALAEVDTRPLHGRVPLLRVKRTDAFSAVAPPIPDTVERAVLSPRHATRGAVYRAEPRVAHASAANLRARPGIVLTVLIEAVALRPVCLRVPARAVRSRAVAHGVFNAFVGEIAQLFSVRRHDLALAIAPVLGSAARVRNRVLRRARVAGVSVDGARRGAARRLGAAKPAIADLATLDDPVAAVRRGLRQAVGVADDRGHGRGRAGGELVVVGAATVGCGRVHDVVPAVCVGRGARRVLRVVFSAPAVSNLVPAQCFFIFK